MEVLTHILTSPLIDWCSLNMNPYATTTTTTKSQTMSHYFDVIYFITIKYNVFFPGFFNKLIVMIYNLPVNGKRRDVVSYAWISFFYWETFSTVYLYIWLKYCPDFGISIYQKKADEITVFCLTSDVSSPKRNKNLFDLLVENPDFHLLKIDSNPLAWLQLVNYSS